MLTAGGGAGASGGGGCRGEVVERWLLRRWGRDASALVEDSDRGMGSALDEVGGRRVVRTDCDLMGISVPAESVVAMRETSHRPAMDGGLLLYNEG